jgi:hypothetical protein
VLTVPASSEHKFLFLFFLWLARWRCYTLGFSYF